MTRVPTAQRRTPARKIAASIAVLAAAAGIELLAAAGGFDDAHDPFPASVVAGP